MRGRSSGGEALRARRSARDWRGSRIEEGNDQRRKQCGYRARLRGMIERLVTQLAVRKAKVWNDGIESGHLLAPRHSLCSGGRRNRTSRSWTGISADRALREYKGGQEKAGKELSVLPRHIPTVYFKVPVAGVRLCGSTVRLSVELPELIRARKVATTQTRRRNRPVEPERKPAMCARAVPMKRTVASQRHNGSDERSTRLSNSPAYANHNGEPTTCGTDRCP